MLIRKLARKAEKKYTLSTDPVTWRYFWFEAGGIVVGILIADIITRIVEHVWQKLSIG